MMQKRLTAKVGTPQPPPQRGVPIYARPSLRAIRAACGSFRRPPWRKEIQRCEYGRSELVVAGVVQLRSL